MTTKGISGSHKPLRKASGPFGSIPKWVLVRQPRLSALELVVLGLIASYDRHSSVGDNAARHRGCMKSTYELAEELGASRAWVSRAIKNLLDIGAIVSDGRVGNRVQKLRVVYQVVSGPTLGGVGADTASSVGADTGWYRCRYQQDSRASNRTIESEPIVRQPYGLEHEDLPFEN